MSQAGISDFALSSGRHLRVGSDVPNGQGFIGLLEAFRATGGTAPVEIVGHLWEEYQMSRANSLAMLLDSGQIFGFEWRASLWIPMFQFAAHDLALKAGAQRVRAELPPLWSGWNLASWFALSNARLDGRCPADMLDADLEAVMRAARSPASVDASAMAPERRLHEIAALA
jgi:hypothetical protein